MKLKIGQEAQTGAHKIATLCPQCGKEGTFDQVGTDVCIAPNTICGQRKCPNPSCKGHLFVVLKSGALVKAYPPIRIDFDSANVPKSVRDSFEEVLDCHAASCFVAAAIMVRRTLEEICRDRGAKGNNLKQRIKDLESKIILPNELIAAMNELRLLGNDAAHVEAEAFVSISNDELNVAIEFTKEILKGLYQYSSLLNKLRALKKKPTG